MTTLKHEVRRITRGLVREHGRNRPIVVTLRPPNIIAFRAKGCHQEYSITVEIGYTMAVRAHVLEKERQKRKKKRQKK